MMANYLLDTTERSQRLKIYHHYGATTALRQALSRWVDEILSRKGLSTAAISIER